MTAATATRALPASRTPLPCTTPPDPTTDDHRTSETTDMDQTTDPMASREASTWR
jgi:hypothetical protein